MREDNGEMPLIKLPFGMSVGDNRREFTINGLSSPEEGYVHSVTLTSLDLDSGTDICGELVIATQQEVAEGFGITSSNGDVFSFKVDAARSESNTPTENVFYRGRYFTGADTMEGVVKAVLAAKLEKTKNQIDNDQKIVDSAHILKGKVKRFLGVSALCAAGGLFFASRNKSKSGFQWENIVASLGSVSCMVTAVSALMLFVSHANTKTYQRDVDNALPERDYYDRLSQAVGVHGISILDPV